MSEELLRSFKAYVGSTGKVVLVVARSCPHCREMLRSAAVRSALSGSYVVVLDVDDDRDRSVAYALFVGTSVEEHLMWARGFRRTIKTPTVVFLKPHRLEARVMEESDNPVSHVYVQARVKGTVAAAKERAAKGRRRGEKE